MLLTLKIRKGNAQLFAWQLFHVHLEHSRVRTYDRGPLEIYWQASGEVRWFIYDNGAWWHHTIKALRRVRWHTPPHGFESLCLLCMNILDVEWVSGWHCFPVMYCDIRCYAVFLNAEAVGPRELLWFRTIQVGDPARRNNMNGPLNKELIFLYKLSFTQHFIWINIAGLRKKNPLIWLSEFHKRRHWNFPLSILLLN